MKLEKIQFSYCFVMETYLAKFRSNLDILSSALAEAAGAARSTIGKHVARDPKFFDSCQQKDIRAGTYDFVVGRFSALWPKELPWPEGVDRPAPSQIEPETLDWFRPRLEAKTPPAETPTAKPSRRGATKASTEAVSG